MKYHPYCGPVCIWLWFQLSCCFGTWSSTWNNFLLTALHQVLRQVPPRQSPGGNILQQLQLILQNLFEGTMPLHSILCLIFSSRAEGVDWWEKLELIVVCRWRDESSDWWIFDENVVEIKKLCPAVLRQSIIWFPGSNAERGSDEAWDWNIFMVLSNITSTIVNFIKNILTLESLFVNIN